MLYCAGYGNICVIFFVFVKNKILLNKLVLSILRQKIGPFNINVLGYNILSTAYIIIWAHFSPRLLHTVICLIHQSFCDNPLCVLKKGIRHLCIMKRKQGICVVSSLFRFFAMAVFYEKSSCFEILQRRVKSLYCYPIYTNLCFSMFYVSWQPIPNFISFKLK